MPQEDANEEYINGSAIFHTSPKKRKIVKFLKSAEQPYPVYKCGIIRLLLKYLSSVMTEWKKQHNLTFWHYSQSILPFVEATILLKMPNVQNNIDKPNSMNFNGIILYFKLKIGFLFEWRISFEDNCTNSDIVELNWLLEKLVLQSTEEVQLLQSLQNCRFRLVLMGISLLGLSTFGSSIFPHESPEADKEQL
ncbi:hypothetical protein AAES_126236 [Amazona aestiva]|uniref:Uncharacterized protein n=1 Tax=Amazona aestiva TaxID=12930 RepID=A0A0Q3UR58_AMAAE|nr:hypothetical protein AAES_126236 [Amazona aestiva]